MTLANTRTAGILISPEDAELNSWRWYLDNRGYVYHAVYRNGNQTNVKLHRLVVERILQRSLVSGEHVDHINGNKLDNRRDNLRVATPAQNSWNKRPVPGSSSKYLGVWFLRRTGRWAAFVKRDGVRYHVGYFASEDEAAWMRDQWALALHGEFASLNFNYV